MGLPDSDLLVATDLDGCLLDEITYSHDEARPALAALAAYRIPLILASSKTRAEMESLSRILGLGWPLVIENGGAVLIADGRLPRPPQGATLLRGWWTVGLGRRRTELLRDLEEMIRETGAKARTFSTLSAGELARATGLGPVALAQARNREYDEPFEVEDEGCIKALSAAASARRLRITRGGRFWHLTGETDKGRALLVLLDLYAADGRRYSTVGLGDSANDLTLLHAVERPIVVPRRGGDPDPALEAALARAEQAPVAGPSGWNRAVLTVLSGGRLPQVGKRST